MLDVQNLAMKGILDVLDITGKDTPKEREMTPKGRRTFDFSNLIDIKP